MYDIIGDVHGYAEVLKKLLETMNYTHDNIKGYAHKSRKAIFVGDFIDRGPQVFQTLEIIKTMVDNGNAFAILGNHEYNAICYKTKDNQGNYIRKHSRKNHLKIKTTIDSFHQKPQQLQDYIEWLWTLPLFFDFGELRVVHAGWLPDDIQFIKEHLPENKLTRSFLINSVEKNTREYEIIKHLLKGPQISLPYNLFVADEEGIVRNNIRNKWWLKAGNHLYTEIAVEENINLPDEIVPSEFDAEFAYYSENEPPVFFGHYWKTGTPQLIAKNICCLDYSIARSGKLLAYRWSGEKILNEKNFVYVTINNSII